MSEKHVLVGKVITGVKLAEDAMAILFQTTEGDIIAKCDADCCSHTWIENVELPVNGFPALVLEADNIAMPEVSTEHNGDYIAYYGFKITTDKGDIIIDYRNSSNGYYGGSLVWPDEKYFYGGVHKQNVSDEVWKDI